MIRPKWSTIKNWRRVQMTWHFEWVPNVDPSVFGFVFVLVSFILKPISFQKKMCFPETANRMLRKSHAIFRTREEQRVLQMKWKALSLSFSPSLSSGQGITFDFTFPLLLSFLSFYLLTTLQVSSTNQPWCSYPESLIELSGCNGLINPNLLLPVGLGLSSVISVHLK